jgi:hypothetical protein
MPSGQRGEHAAGCGVGDGGQRYPSRCERSRLVEAQYVDPPERLYASRVANKRANG